MHLSWRKRWVACQKVILRTPVKSNRLKTEFITQESNHKCASLICITCITCITCNNCITCIPCTSCFNININCIICINWFTANVKKYELHWTDNLKSGGTSASRKNDKQLDQWHVRFSYFLKRAPLRVYSRNERKFWMTHLHLRWRSVLCAEENRGRGRGQFLIVICEAWPGLKTTSSKGDES